MEAKLLIVGGRANKGQVPLRLPTVIGRSRDAGLTVAHPMVSRQHCELFEVDGLIRIRDLGSLNGTFLGQQQVKEADLYPGTEFTVGPLTFRVEYEYAGEIPSAPAEPEAPAWPAISGQAPDFQPVFPTAQADAENVPGLPDFSRWGAVDGGQVDEEAAEEPEPEPTPPPPFVPRQPAAPVAPAADEEEEEEPEPEPTPPPPSPRQLKSPAAEEPAEEAEEAQPEPSPPPPLPSEAEEEPFYMESLDDEAPGEPVEEAPVAEMPTMFAGMTPAEGEAEEASGEVGFTVANEQAPEEQPATTEGQPSAPAAKKRGWFSRGAKKPAEAKQPQAEEAASAPAEEAPAAEKPAAKKGWWRFGGGKKKGKAEAESAEEEAVEEEAEAVAEKPAKPVKKPAKPAKAAPSKAPDVQFPAAAPEEGAAASNQADDEPDFFGAISAQQAEEDGGENDSLNKFFQGLK
jgi:hypothetical protein